MTKREWQERQHQNNALAALGISERDADRLRRISASLRRIGERQCNEEMSERDYEALDEKSYRLARAARGIVYASERALEAAVYVQTDPRGCALYVIPPAVLERYRGLPVDSIYNNGIAVYS